MIEVVGGVYRELCYDPQWDQWFGSGLRAAAHLVTADTSVRLASYADMTAAPVLAAMSRSFGVDVSLTPIERSVSFEYEHPLAIPRIVPGLHELAKGTPISLEGDRFVRFGMLEGEGIVRAREAVYDPQSAHEPQLFRANGSTAARLAVVCNRREAIALGGTDDLDKAMATIGKLDGAAVVIVKQGSRGARIFADGHYGNVPAFQTESVWPIGSGDVFTAGFARGWMIEKLSAIDAARRASLSVARYCESRQLGTSEGLDQFDPAECPISQQAPIVYLAGPFFDTAQRWMIRQARNALRDAGLRVFSPLHDVGHGSANDVAEKDLDGLEQSDAVFALCDGLDSGTLFEVGYARKLGLPVVVLVQREAEESLKMLRGSGCVIMNDFSSAVYRVAWIANG